MSAQRSDRQRLLFLMQEVSQSQGETAAGTGCRAAESSNDAHACLFFGLIHSSLFNVSSAKYFMYLSKYQS